MIQVCLSFTTSPLATLPGTSRSLRFAGKMSFGPTEPSGGGALSGDLTAPRLEVLERPRAADFAGGSWLVNLL